ncbi:MAG: inositol monophosphatase, partial [Chloroflexota bacterium]|nr:inositol monophosphatase [Chloroflexota bacterium]
PLRGELFAAARGQGATLNGQPIAVSGTVDVGRALVVSGIQSDDRAVVQSAMERVQALINTVRAVRLPGSPALSLSYVASGRAEAFCHGCINSWDVAAGALLVEEAGGRVTRYQGPWALDVQQASSILGSNGRVHESLLRVLNR